MTDKILLLNGDQAKSVVFNTTDHATFMTSDILPTPLKASATSVSSATYAAWKAFNGTNISGSDCWLSAASVKTGRLSIDYSIPKKVNKVSITSRNDATASTLSPKKFTIEGSDDDLSWAILHTLDNETGWAANQTRTYMLPNEYEHKNYRINVLDNNGGAQLSIGEVLFSYVDLSFSNVDVTVQNHIDFGINLKDLSKMPYYRIYNEFGEFLGISYYTDNPSKASAQLEITANYSPMDEIQEDFEVVTWTDEETDPHRILSLQAIPKPQFVKQIAPTSMPEVLESYTIKEAINSSAKFLLSPDLTTWRKWNGVEFISIQPSEIQNAGMAASDILSLTKEQWKTWIGDKLYLGIYVDENSKIDNINYKELSPRESTKLSDAKLYILNTVSTINVKFAGSTLTGTIDDEDEGKVQYRVILNGKSYYPKDGSFTDLQPSPQNIGITLSNKDYLIDQNNILRVEFRDYWGTTDFWEAAFIGAYSGLLFSNTAGEYFSTEIGEVLKKLDFGVIIAGQTTTEQQVVLKNTYGHPVENVTLYSKANPLPNGMKVQFGTNLTSFEAVERLNLAGRLENDQTASFFVRLSTQLGITPPTAGGEFDIVVVADEITT